MTSRKKRKSQLSPKSLFTSRIEHSDSHVIEDSRLNFREPIVSTKGTNSETNSLIPVLDEVLVDTMATLTTLLNTVPITKPAPVPTAGPDVPIAVQMGAIGDCTTSVAPLPTFSRWPSADLCQHLS